MPCLVQHDIGGLQVHIEVTRPAAQGQGGAQVQPQVYSLGVGHGGAAQDFFQSAAVTADQIHMIPQPVFLHGRHLPALIALEPIQLGHALQELRLRGGIIGHLTIVVQSGGRVFVGACYQQCVQLGLGRGDGQNLYDVFLIGSLLHGGAAAHTRTAAHGRTQHKAIQKRGREIGFRHFFRLLNSHIIK